MDGEGGSNVSDLDAGKITYAPGVKELKSDSNFVLGNALAGGCPIVYCSDGFCELTGLPRAQVMGRSCACKFLYAEDTKIEDKAKIDEALEKKEELKIDITFKKKNGYNAVFVAERKYYLYWLPNDQVLSKKVEQFSSGLQVQVLSGQHLYLLLQRIQLNRRCGNVYNTFTADCVPAVDSLIFDPSPKHSDTFLCLLDIVPIKNEKNQVVLLLVSHKNISEEGISSSLGTQKDETNESDENDSDGEMAEAYRQCQTRRRGEHESDDDFRYQRRRSRAVLYHLSGQFGKQNKAKSKLQQFNKLVESSSMSAKMPEYKVQEVKKSRFILVHYGIFKIGWDWLILLCTFYTAVMVPYNAAFTLQFGVFRSSIYSDVVVEIIFIFDIVLNFRTSFVNKGGQVVYQARLIAINYIKGWFGLDLLAAIPFDFLYIFNINTTAPVHLLKVARLLRLARLLQKIDRFSQYGALVLALLMSMFALVAHWLACIWYAIGNEELNTPNWTAGWIYELGERLDNPMTSNRTNKPDSLSCYLAALYFTCSSLTSVGFGNVSANTNAEKIFSVCAMIVGALMHAVVFGNVTAIIQRMYARRANFHSKTKDLKDFFHAHHLPKPLKMRMQDYFQTMWSLNNGIETNEILKDFPEEMRGEIGLHLHKEILSLSVFENAPQGCLKSISLHSRRVFCAPGEFLVHKGDATNYLYLLCSGSMEILREEMVVAILGKGDLFGTDINFDDPITVSGYDVRSLTYSELQCISLKGLVDVLGLYPEFSERFTQELCNDLTYNLREGAEESDEDTNSNIQSRKLKLPSISEDDENSGSDDGVSNDKDDEKEMGGDESVAHSASSPLLPNHRNANVPIGEFDVFTRDDKSPTTTRSIHNSLRRTGSGPQRKSFKEKKRLGGNSDAAYEKLYPHVQNMQTEVEGAKASIKQLEKRVLKIGQDVSSIDRNIKELMKIVASSSPRFSPEETMPSTPYTPISRPVFTFDPSCSEDALSVGRMLKCDQCSYSTASSFQSVNEISNRSQRSLLLGTSRKQDVNENILSPRKPPDIRLNKSSDALLSLGGDKSLKPHEPLIRRHSDGPVERKQTAQSRDPFEVQNEQESKQQSSCGVVAPYQEMMTLGQEFIVAGDDAEKPIRLSEIHSNGCIGNMSSVNHPNFHNRAETTFETGGGTETIEIITSPQSVTHVHKRLDGMILRTTDL